jgi:metallophosphoesterase superfamily enzyme
LTNQQTHRSNKTRTLQKEHKEEGRKTMNLKRKKSQNLLVSKISRYKNSYEIINGDFIDETQLKGRQWQ